MKTSDFYYDLPEELIAQTPVAQRDTSRLMTLDKTSGTVEHHHFYELVEYLKPGDCLIMNNSRVLPARLLGQRLPGGGACEVLLQSLALVNQHQSLSYFHSSARLYSICDIGTRTFSPSTNIVFFLKKRCSPSNFTPHLEQ